MSERTTSRTTIHDENVDLIVAVLTRIADTLDDYMDMTLAATAATQSISAIGPEARAMLKPLTDAIQVIVDRRAVR